MTRLCPWYGMLGVAVVDRACEKKQSTGEVGGATVWRGLACSSRSDFVL